MQATALTQILLPLALALIMFGMGLSLHRRDFSRLFKLPQSVAAGLLGQVIGLPLLALLVIVVFNLSTPLAIGLMLVAVCPGGTTSNLLCHLARANLALSVSLTALSNLICVVTAPLLVGLSLQWFATGAAVEFSLVNTALGLFAISLLPVGVGMVVRHYYSDWAERTEPVFRGFSIAVLILLIVAITVQEWHLLTTMLEQLLLACLTFNLLGLAIGYGLSKLFSLDNNDTTTVAIEVGVQNTTLSMLIAITFLGHPDYAITAGVYGLVMYLGAAVTIGLRRYQRNQVVDNKSSQQL
ncbi:bile acid:sodium symporter family protein [Ferrimonas lipolytica]|uniref:Bile acid:sodium symporter family protein n=1 Tax=Ferrimonas lipolytica TaxID=2724191 RepID=A0A6H1UFB2_9GAMM|nr:bile acid:sodium symporter family protein [Ferrimonas lipolytica]QIZ77734.1 bile acid:sodium symporter family protein [Ferrimonas lipolytica]